MSVNDLFKKANKLLQNNHIEGLKIYKDIFLKYPQKCEAFDEVKRQQKNINK